MHVAGFELALPVIEFPKSLGVTKISKLVLRAAFSARISSWVFSCSCNLEEAEVKLLAFHTPELFPVPGEVFRAD
jgi:hypothetical protein